MVENKLIKIMKVLTIYLSEGQTLSQWAVKEANSLINSRYKLVHLAQIGRAHV